MRAAWYEKQGPAGEVLVVGDMRDPWPRSGRVEFGSRASGINPGDIKMRQDSLAPLAEPERRDFWEICEASLPGPLDHPHFATTGRALA